MATVSKFASANAVVTTGWTSPTNAYADDTSYATASPGRNATVDSDFKFADFSTGDIPDGSAINSVTITARAWGSNATYMTEGIRGRVSGADNGTEGTTTSITEVTISCTLSGVTLANLRAASTTVFARVRASKGATNTAYTGSLDWVQITVDYTGPQAKSGSDSGTGTDSASVAEAKSGSDSGTATDTASLAAAISPAGAGFTRGSLVASDDFSTDNASSWGTADTGGAWGVGLAVYLNEVYSTYTGIADISSVAADGHYGEQVLSGTIADLEYQVEVQGGAWAEADDGSGFAFRNGTNKYVALVDWQSSTSIRLRLLYGPTATAAPLLTQIATSGAITVASTNNWFTIHGWAIGTTHKIRVWKTGDSEPATYNIDTTDSSSTSAGKVGLLDGISYDASNTFDNFNVWGSSGGGGSGGETGTATDAAA